MNATITTRTHHNGRYAAVRRAVLRSGNPSQITLPGGTVRTQQYDGLLRLKTLAVKDPGQSSVMNYQYNYDLTDNITSKATEAGTTNYSYDALDRLTAAAYTNTAQTNEAYSYDPVANRLTDSNTAAAVWSYDANNQLTQILNAVGTISYSYDDNGNTISTTDSANAANTRNYVYDTESGRVAAQQRGTHRPTPCGCNRLIEVRDGSNTLIAAYSYDPFGRRLSKDAGTQKTYYLYNEEGLIAEADATGQVTRSYGYAPGSTYTTNPLWLKTGTAYYTYQNDHLGTPMKLLSQSGAVVWSATYDAFGKATVNPASTVTSNLRLPGQYYDQETGLHYNWMRYYDPGTGRYVTSDPVGLRGGINMYTYVGENPLVWIDPWGLARNPKPWFDPNKDSINNRPGPTDQTGRSGRTGPAIERGPDTPKLRDKIINIVLDKLIQFATGFPKVISKSEPGIFMWGLLHSERLGGCDNNGNCSDMMQRSNAGKGNQRPNTGKRNQQLYAGTWNQQPDAGTGNQCAISNLKRDEN